MLLLPLLIWAATLIGCVQPYDDLECGKKYTCLVPDECVNETKKVGKIVKVENSLTIDPNCTLIIRFHRYSLRAMRVVLETRDTSKDYASIVVQVLKRASDQSKAESLFSCVRDGDKAVGRVGAKIAKQLGGLNAISPLRCSFDAARLDDNLVWHVGPTDDLNAEITGIDKAVVKFVIDDGPHVDIYCDPELLVGPKTIDAENRPTERYAPIQYDLGNLSCPAIYDRIEFRKGTFERIETIVCEYKGFVINGVQFTDSTQTLEVRCVADADYFCDYDVKAPQGLDKRKRLVVTPGKPDEKKRSRIECPENYPYFVMGSRAPVVDYNLTCRTKLTKQLWHYGDTAITKDGPIVYCTDALTCPKLAPTSFDGSYLDKDNQPTCQKDGTLQLKKGGSTILDPFEGRVGCNEKEGWMGYETKGLWQRITDEVFYCHYIDHAEQKNEENKKSVVMTVLYAFLIALGIFGAAGGACFWCFRRKKLAEWRKQEQKEIEESNRMQKNPEPPKNSDYPPVCSVRSLCGKKMPLRLTAEPDPKPTTLKTTKAPWSLPPFAITSTELLAESPLSGRPIEEALFEKVFATMDETFRATMSMLPVMWANSDQPSPMLDKMAVYKTTPAELLFDKMKAEGSVTGEFVPLTPHPLLASEERTAVIAGQRDPAAIRAAKKPQQQQQQPKSAD